MSDEIIFLCIGCESRLRAPGESVGAVMACARCRTANVVPQPAPSPAASAARRGRTATLEPATRDEFDHEDEDRSSRRTRRPRDETPASARGIKYVADDPSWFSKVIVGGFIASIPIVEAISDGFQIRTIRNIQDGRSRPLPEWSNLGSLFAEGIKLRLVIYAMYLPALALSILTVIVDVSWIAAYLVDDEAARAIWRSRRLARWIFIPLLNLFVAVVQFFLFLGVPALARRAADGASFISLFNPMPTLRMIAANLPQYITARLMILLLVAAFGAASVLVGVLGWVIVMGPVVGWLILAVGRFWSRLSWAYYLAHMKTNAQAGSP